MSEKLLDVLAQYISEPTAGNLKRLHGLAEQQEAELTVLRERAEAAGERLDTLVKGLRWAVDVIANTLDPGLEDSAFMAKFSEVRALLDGATTEVTDAD